MNEEQISKYIRNGLIGLSLAIIILNSFVIVGAGLLVLQGQ